MPEHTPEGTPVSKGTGSKPASVQKKKPVRLVSQEKKIGEDEFMAAAIGDVEWLRQSIRGNRGAINYDKNGLAPIHLAAIHGRLDCLRLLVEKIKVDIDLPSKTGWRAVHLVISNQTGKRAFSCLCYLLDQGADPSVCNEDGITPAHQAASDGHVQCLKALIDTGAKVDGVDYRGHTPLDLAKLWGHRKCARLLAAELWHQDKDFLASEMNQLKKLQMKQVLREIEADQEQLAHQKFYGDLAFKEWLATRGLTPRSTGPQTNEDDEVAPAANKQPQPVKQTQQSSSMPQKGQKASPRKDNPTPRPVPEQESVFKANSVQRPAVRPQPRAPSPIREESFSSRQTQSTGEPFLVSQEPTNLTQADGAEPPPPPANLANTGFFNTITWNKSTQIPKKQYEPILPDHYPHDEYTMQPKHPPKRYTQSPSVLMEEDGDTMSVLSSANEHDRAVVYNCKHIHDVHKKKHYDPEYIPKSEIGMHLANDTGSKLFKNGLLKKTKKRPSSGNSPGPRPRNMDLASMMNLMERMSKPTRYPPINGPEYDLRVGQHA